MSTRLSENTLAVLSNCRIEGNKLHLPNIQLDRKNYLDVNKALDSIGGKWSKKDKAHLFVNDPTELLEEIMLTGVVSAKRDQLKELGYFPTPDLVADRVVGLLGLSAGQYILEPSIGKGSLFKAVRRVEKSNIFKAYEINPDFYNELLTLNIDEIIFGDFLNSIPAPDFDRVVMNPPFNKSRADIHHVLHAFKFLKPGGRLVAIMPCSVTFRQDKLTTEFRDLVLSCGCIDALPEGSFKESGTSVNTVVVVLNKANES